VPNPVICVKPWQMALRAWRMWRILALAFWRCSCEAVDEDREEQVRAALAGLEEEENGRFRKYRRRKRELDSFDLRSTEQHVENLSRNGSWLDSERCESGSNGTWISQLAHRLLNSSAEEERRRPGRGKASLAEKRFNYMAEKLQVDREVVRKFSVPSVLPSWPGSPQVAFLFMTVDGLDFEDVWDRFFGDASLSGAYSIYIHRASGRQSSGLRFAERFSGWGMPWSASLPLSRWGAIEIPQVETRWCALFGVEVALLARALQDPHNQQFVFASHNTVPLKSFDYVHKQLALGSPGTSKFCFAEVAFHKLATSETIRNELRRTCVFRDFIRSISPRTLKHHQWVVLSREHAEIVVRRAEEALMVWRDSWVQAAPDLLHMGEGCSDESVPIDALLYDLEQTERSTGNTWADLTRLGVEQQCLTYVLWRHCFADTHLDHSETIARDLDIVLKHGKLSMLTDRQFNFFKSALKRELNGYPAVFDALSLEYVWKLVQEGFMFARKFVKGIQVKIGEVLYPLAEVLPALWDTVDDFNASQRVWSRLSIEGKPKPI